MPVIERLFFVSVLQGYNKNIFTKDELMFYISCIN